MVEGSIFDAYRGNFKGRNIIKRRAHAGDNTLEETSYEPFIASG